MLRAGAWDLTDIAQKTWAGENTEFWGFILEDRDAVMWDKVNVKKKKKYQQQKNISNVMLSLGVFQGPDMQRVAGMGLACLCVT